MDDAALYELLRQDADAGMRVCIEQYYALVYSICSGILRRHPQDTEECVNLSFLRLWETLDRLEQPQHLRAYLCCISRNAAISRCRALRRDAQYTSDTEPETADTDFLLLLDRRADAERLQNAIMTLKEPDREIFVRKYYYMESMQALAERFGVSVKAIDNTLYRSKRRLRRILKEESE
ncbi:MAG: sigma-70 family RNA polymerase sigma factor [Oscillospiraceae bacterium]|nr:sigma-70 family RNA polymerase sigma factor [Oscillospiraceae bacterium]